MLKLQCLKHKIKNLKALPDFLMQCLHCKKVFYFDTDVMKLQEYKGSTLWTNYKIKITKSKLQNQMTKGTIK